jgi:hypothetical protein
MKFWGVGRKYIILNQTANKKKIIYHKTTSPLTLQNVQYRQLKFANENL